MNFFSRNYCIFWIKIFEQEDFPTFFWQPKKTNFWRDDGKMFHSLPRRWTWSLTYWRQTDRQTDVQDAMCDHRTAVNVICYMCRRHTVW